MAAGDGIYIHIYRALVLAYTCLDYQVRSDLYLIGCINYPIDSYREGAIGGINPTFYFQLSWRLLYLSQLLHKKLARRHRHIERTCRITRAANTGESRGGRGSRLFGSSNRWEYAGSGYGHRNRCAC